MKSRSASYLALGDSYTLGEGVETAESWPFLLAQALRESGFPALDPRVVARTGWTTEDLLKGIEEVGPSQAFDLVSLLIGANDHYRGRDLQAFDSGFRRVLDRAVELAEADAGRVLVLSIPDWGKTPHAEGRNRARIREQIDAFNDVKRKAAEAAGVFFLNVTEISREAVREPRFLVDDGLHPSGAMYARWVNVALPRARKILEGRSLGGA